MSEEEDTELRDLVVQNLEKNGTLAHLKAQLRASIFLAIDDQEKIKSKGPLSNERMEKYSQTEIGRICCGLISDFFQCMTMKATQSVFKPESGSKEISTRDQTAKFLDIELTKEIKDDVPLLEIVLNSALKLGRISNGYANELIKSDVKKATSPFSDQFKKVTAGGEEFFGESPLSPPDNQLFASTITQRNKSLGNRSSVNLEPAFNAPTAPQKSKHNDSFNSKFDSLISNMTENDKFKEVSSENGRSNLLGDLPNLTSAASTFASFSKSTPAMKNKTSNEFSLKDLIGDSDDSQESTGRKEKSVKKTLIEPKKLNQIIGDNSKSKKPDVSEDEISEEIVEDLEVEDLLNSSHSPHQISF